MPTRNDQANGWQLRFASLLMGFQKCGANVSFQMIDRNERPVQRMSERFSVSNPDQKRTNQARAAGYADGVQILEAQAGLLHRFADHRNNFPQVFPRCQLGYDSAILAVNIDLRSHDAREDVATVGNHRGGGFVARRLYAQDSYRFAGLFHGSA